MPEQSPSTPASGHNLPLIRDLRLLITGGTLDKTYNPVAGVLDFSRTNVLCMLHQARVNVPEDRIQTVLLKDSLDLVEADREAICQACADASESRIIITHGTDTMIETARHVAAAGLPKTIVLVGAMVPYTFSNSDALFNLGTAVAAVQLLPSGVYVTMNGRSFNWDRVRKNREQGVFEAS